MIINPTTVMSKKKEHEVYIQLFKLFGVYQLVDPSSPKIFRYKVYNLINIFLVVCSTTLVMIGLSGIFFKVEKPTIKMDNAFKDFQMLFVIACAMVGNIKIMTIVLNANEIFNLLNIAHESFLSIKLSKMNQDCVKFGKHFNKVFPWYFFLLFISLILWITTPIFLNITNSVSPENIHKPNFFNLKYPINVETYNTFFMEFYIVETIITIYFIYCIIIFDLFLFSILQLLSNYYEIISSTFEYFDIRSGKKDGEFIISI